jgi:hypothetical protein
VNPGEYEVRLIVATQTLTQKLIVDQDPRAHISGDDLAKQLALELQIDSALEANANAYREIVDLRAKLLELDARLFGKSKAKEIRSAANALDEAADKIAGREVEYPLLPAGLVELDRTLSSLAVTVGAADSVPTAQSSEALGSAQKRLSDQLAKWGSLKKQDLAAFNVQLVEAGLAPIVPGGSGKPTGE